jgi:Trk K+ transport system NAD-binding subunit
MLTGKRFILCGLSRLTLRVARMLRAEDADVTVVRLGRDTEQPAGAFGPDVRAVDSLDADHAEMLAAAGAGEATCVLALSEDDLDNLRIAVAAREAAPDTPVVLRAFDPVLADQLEQGLNVRRAYSVSALAAPAFVAATFGDQVIETMRLGDGEVPLSAMTVGPGSPLDGRTPEEVKRVHGCAILARRGPDGSWRTNTGDDGGALHAGEEVLAGGTLAAMLRLSSLNSALPSGRGKRPRALSRSARGRKPRRPLLVRTRLPHVAAALVAPLVVGIVLFTFFLKLPVIDSVSFIISTVTNSGTSDLSLKNAPAWLKLFSSLVVLSGAALLGIFYSYLTALATTERLDEIMGKRARGLSGHIVVAGLGNLGYRVASHFIDLGWSVGAIELSPNARFVEALRTRCPVLSGDARLPDNLERASIRSASAFVACTNDDLANIQACLHARRLNPSLITVARVFDDVLAVRLCQAFEIDRALSATQCAAGAFIGAAVDERAMRPFEVGGLDFLAFRYTVPDRLSRQTLDAWRAAGIRVVAVRTAASTDPSPAQLDPTLDAGDEAILCGPAEAMRRLFAV